MQGFSGIGRLPVGYALVLAAVSGLCVLVAFPPYGIWVAAPVGVAGLAVACMCQRILVGALLGLVHGLVFFVPLLHWTGLYVGAFPWLLLASFEALYMAGLGATLALVSAIPGVFCPLRPHVKQWELPRAAMSEQPQKPSEQPRHPAVVRQRELRHRLREWRWGWPFLVALLWVAQEAVRSRFPFGGFGWGRLAFSQAEAPTLSFAAIGGAPLVTFVVALAGGFLTIAFLPLPRTLSPGRLFRKVTPTSLSQRGLLRKVPSQVWGSVVASVGLLVFGLAIPLTEPSGRETTVAVVQGNVPRAGLDFNAQRRQVLRNHAEETLALAREVAAGKKPQPTFVVWPENSSDVDPFIDDEAAKLITAAAKAIKAPILVGAVLDGPGRFISNTGLVWEPSVSEPRVDVTERYVKQHPVPFAEYVPFRSLARRVSDKVDLVRRDFVAGKEPGVLTIGSVRIGDVICFEVAYDQLVSGTVRDGAQMLVVQTNNATFGRTAQSAQQLAMVQLRAVEHGLYAVMASTSGISAAVNPRGGVLSSTKLFTGDTLVETVRLRNTPTLATRFGVAIELILCSLAFVALVVAIAFPVQKVLRTRGKANLDKLQSSVVERRASDIGEDRGAKRSE